MELAHFRKCPVVLVQQGAALCDRALHEKPDQSSWRGPEPRREIVDCRGDRGAETELVVRRYHRSPPLPCRDGFRQEGHNRFRRNTTHLGGDRQHVFQEFPSQVEVETLAWVTTGATDHRRRLPPWLAGRARGGRLPVCCRRWRSTMFRGSGARIIGCLSWPLPVFAKKCVSRRGRTERSCSLRGIVRRSNRVGQRSLAAGKDRTELLCRIGHIDCSSIATTSLLMTLTPSIAASIGCIILFFCQGRRVASFLIASCHS